MTTHFLRGDRVFWDGDLFEVLEEYLSNVELQTPAGLILTAQRDDVFLFMPRDFLDIRTLQGARVGRHQLWPVGEAG